jgi:putative endonuclease
MYHTYIIKSLKNNLYYIGHTNNTVNRLKDHNKGKNKYTKPYLPWDLVYTKFFNTRSEAMKHEKELKSLKSRKALEKIIDAK